MTHTQIYLFGLAARYSLRVHVDIPVVLFFLLLFPLLMSVSAACVCLGAFVYDIQFSYVFWGPNIRARSKNLSKKKVLFLDAGPVSVIVGVRIN